MKKKVELLKYGKRTAFAGASVTPRAYTNKNEQKV
jgi:Na+-translocating ferredoxin:NAD+ oxidoreductase RnfG subunit